MSFEESFPSLKGKSIGKCYGNAEFKEVSGETLPEIIPNSSIFSEREIKEYCLDKAKVKEVYAWITKEINIAVEQVELSERYLKKHHEGYLSALKKVQAKFRELGI